MGGENLPVEHELVSVLSHWTPVDLEESWVLLPDLKVGGFDDKSVDLGSILTLETDLFRFS